ncbi:transcriptional repressor DicA [Sebaldella termitidis]|uniref:Transcriptional regulator, XRE family n=1 Tax=Sebaldella termitidis (strain ATCC 33386 / NCTC 11300) TaxID=526218 RepID=D1AHL8_SEBTE|nr:helix-turn-helix transcriptional regulator [Sebaldella termitidis]ACZ08252.1 transcriptional regulator, XRE family [Sebaldella termitidis ATCC 33386]SUI23560.1 transcriptional repressor DicA [Sebaldella termitidis]
MGNKDIANRMKRQRLNLEYSYKDLEKITGITASTLQRYETGAINKLPIDKLEVIAKALKVSPSYLMGWEDEKGNPLTNKSKITDPISQLSKKEKFEYDKFMESATYFFNDETVSDEDKKKFSDALQNAFVTALMQKNKKKKK